MKSANVARCAWNHVKTLNRSFSTLKQWSDNNCNRVALINSVTNLSVDDATSSLLEGPGFAVYDNLLSEKDLARANRAVENILQTQPREEFDASNVEHETGHSEIYSNENNDGRSQGTRIWNLLNKGKIFEELVLLEPIMSVFDNILGNDFILGSFAANHLQPNATAQLMHLDYPYWDYNNRKSWPQKPKFNKQHLFAMNCQTLIMLDDFTLENGSTRIIPYSQQNIAWPNPEMDSNKQDIGNDGTMLVTGKAGSVLLFTGLLQHGSTCNNSNASRTSILGQYLPKYVRPMENIEYQVCNEVKQRANDRMKQLLGFHQIYPKVFEEPTEQCVHYDEM